MKQIIKNAICVVYFLFMVLCAAVLTILGIPVALVFAIGVCPFATVRWALERDETWVESWKETAKAAVRC